MNLYLILFLLSIPSLAALFEPVTTFFVWDKSAIEAGQWWRILTGNFAHTNFEHFAMNIIVLWIIALIFRPKAFHYFIITMVVNVGVGVGLLATTLAQYVGLSGTLHGIFVYFALLECFQGRRSSWLLVAGVIAKVLWEQLVGPSSYTQALIQAPVAIQAHLIGLVWGGIGILIYQKFIYQKKDKLQ